MQYAKLFLNRVINENDTAALRRHNITVDDMPTKIDADTLRFIEGYAEENNGEAPSYAAVASSVEGFEYLPEVSDSFTYLAKQVKDYTAKRMVDEWFRSGEFERSINEMGGQEFVNNWLPKKIESIIMRTNVRETVGKTLDDIGKSMKDEYLKRELGKSFKLWKTPFSLLDKEISGFFSGDVYGIIAESGRGKTYLIMKMIDSLLRQGANVLLKSFEMKEYILMARLISIATAKDELLLDEIGRKVGIPNQKILSGNLEGVTREQFFKILDSLNTYYKGELYLQAKSDSSLTRTLDELESELSQGGIDVVVLDPFYGLSDVYGRNVNKTAGGAAEYAATRFENIVGDNDVVGIYAVQATVEKKETDEDGNRELDPPTRDQVKTSKRLLDIATVLFSFDSLEKEGRAMLGIEKGRSGGEDFKLELTALFDYGVIEELGTGEDALEGFDF